MLKLCSMIKIIINILGVNYLLVEDYPEVLFCILNVQFRSMNLIT